MHRLITIFFLIFLVIPVNAQDIDLQEANVTKVEYQLIDGTEYNFDVTLYHDDDGEAPNYADSWQVETLNGTILGTRILAHSHGTVEFTRSATITIPVNIHEIVVRGHDQNHGYGGQVCLINMTSNEFVYFDQGEESIDFSEYHFNGTQSDIQSNESSANIDYTTILPIFLISIIIYRRRK